MMSPMTVGMTNGIWYSEVARDINKIPMQLHTLNRTWLNVSTRSKVKR